jgi:RNA polymerase sigma-70 factor (ECF subfamily)
MSLKTYVRGSFPTIRDVEDVVQESYLRIWKARAEVPIRSVQALLFRVARHIAIDLVRRQRRSPIDVVEDLAALEAPATAPTSIDALVREEKIRLLSEAIDALPDRCREVVILRKLRLLPQREVAARLGISESGVEIQLARGLERCRAFLRKRGAGEFYRHG